MSEEKGIKILNENYDLRSISDIELVSIMQTQCDVYDMAYHEMSTAILEVWAAIERIAEEILNRNSYGPEDETLERLQKRR